jgi:hypothetical protein
MELTFVKEELPKITRAGGSGREAEPWENHLAPLKETPDQTFRVWTYDKRTSAISRSQSVRNRLTAAVPNENWRLAVRPVQVEGVEKFGVYVAFDGIFTAEEVAANAKAHQERSERVKAARAKSIADKAAAENGALTNEQIVADREAAADRVAAARTAKQKATVSK